MIVDATSKGTEIGNVTWSARAAGVAAAAPLGKGRMRRGRRLPRRRRVASMGHQRAQGPGPDWRRRTRSRAPPRSGRPDGPVAVPNWGEGVGTCDGCQERRPEVAGS